MDLKKPLTFDEQVDKLVSHGIIVEDRKVAKRILQSVNYYRHLVPDLGADDIR